MLCCGDDARRRNAAAGPLRACPPVPSSVTSHRGSVLNAPPERPCFGPAAKRLQGISSAFRPITPAGTPVPIHRDQGIQAENSSCRLARVRSWPTGGHHSWVGRAMTMAKIFGDSAVTAGARMALPRGCGSGPVCHLCRNMPRTIPGSFCRQGRYFVIGSSGLTKTISRGG